MKKAPTVRVDPELLDAARACAVMEHRTPTNFVEASLLSRVGEAGTEEGRASRAPSRTLEGPTCGE